ncbi:peptide deformylase [Gluconobacter wancherniae]|uniref:Peptide deformylase n=1 Tax=Gluconobacter wancherniae NBRC 103581 TaxID=656744 RepID=A0A511AZ92_9PROT|nr:peptide deformylase [Gluconobacter wancherniae]MBF0853680.1 peptide deformylase [Gluconobacter wancherniae]MBS1063097.1 peptide deformylase [Gluconobacter wancherniae]GBD55574.1 peptide deformylase [Gluconobacter wancherniae NBRC 103581]GBR66518.1 peptide deformylase [Gluconobacter wancherniae NBRC 103581]GEK93524.1 peptide deformylase [Gluconobacter wancherniae NBRC 103581]
MTLLKIARMGHPVLHRVAEPVSDVNTPQIQKLIADMLETMADARGAGLAAPQVHEGLRLIVYHVPVSRVENPEEALPPQVLINPVLTAVGRETMMCVEGCLSIPGLRGEVSRHARVHYAGLDASGNLVEGEASGFHANVLQHECDHLDGILYPQRITDYSRFGFVEELSR